MPKTSSSGNLEALQCSTLMLKDAAVWYPKCGYRSIELELPLTIVVEERTVGDLAPGDYFSLVDPRLGNILPPVLQRTDDHLQLDLDLLCWVLLPATEEIPPLTEAEQQELITRERETTKAFLDDQPEPPRIQIEARLMQFEDELSNQNFAAFAA